MKQYPKYKDSKIPWIDDVPEHGKTKRLAIAFSENKSKNSEYIFQRALKFNYGSLVAKNEPGDISDLKNTYVDYTILAPKDIVINCLNLNYDFVSLRVAQAQTAGIITSAYLSITPRREVNSDFYTYFFKAMDSQKLFHGMGTGIRLTLSFSELKKQTIVVPPTDEQQAIVDFLDKAVEKIDRYIAAKEAEIEKLGTLKQSIISQAVTKGLDPNVSMKDSGIPWIGDVPEHWETKRLAIAFSENKRKNSEYTFQKALKFNYGSLVAKNESGDISDLKNTYVDYTILAPKDIVINCLNLNYDFVSLRVAQAQTAGIITSAYLSITPRREVNSDFYTYFFKAMDSQKLFHGMGTGIRLTLSYSELKKQNIVVPPADEQQAIVKYIDEQVQKIETSISNIRQRIEKLKTYKQRLISDAVTGKIDVRNAKTDIMKYGVQMHEK